MTAKVKTAPHKRADPRKAPRTSKGTAAKRPAKRTGGTVLTFGTFDPFHCGHLRMLQRARAFGSRLVVGVSSDRLNHSKKGKDSPFSEKEQLAIVGGLRVVDEVFVEASLEEKADSVRRFKADVLVMGEDLATKFDWVGKETGCKVVYLERTPSISTTALVEKIQSSG